MRFLRYLSAAAAIGAALVVSPAAQAGDWGQEVKECNHTPGCYPGDGSRGSYVSGQARDQEGPGYAWEIHTLANPGGSARY